MNRDDIQKLLGGYATGTLTPEEQEALFSAALDDQELFDQLAREQALRDLLRDPAAKAQVLAALDDVRLRWYQRLGRWMMRPAGLGVAAAGFLAVAGGGYVVWQAERPRPLPIVAELKLKEMPPAPAPRATPPQAPKASRPAPPGQPRFEQKGGFGGIAGGVVGGVVGGVPQGAARGSLGSVTGNLSGIAPAPTVIPPPPPLAVPAPDKAVAQAAPSVVTGAKPPQPAAANAPLSGRSELVELSREPASAAGARSLYFGSRQPAEDAAKRTIQPMAGMARVRQPMAMAGPANLGVAWSVWRREPGGELTKADAEDLRAGETVQLRIVPNDSGFLSVMEGRPGEAGFRVLAANRRVERLAPFETGALTADATGLKEYTVLFSRQPLNAPGQPAAENERRTNLVRTAAEQESETDTRGHDTYVVQTGNAAPAQPVLVTVRLLYR